MACGRLLKLRGVDLVEEPERASYLKKVMLGLAGVDASNPPSQAQDAH